MSLKTHQSTRVLSYARVPKHLRRKTLKQIKRSHRLKGAGLVVGAAVVGAAMTSQSAMRATEVDRSVRSKQFDTAFSDAVRERKQRGSIGRGWDPELDYTLSPKTRERYLAAKQKLINAANRRIATRNQALKLAAAGAVIGATGTGIWLAKRRRKNFARKK